MKKYIILSMCLCLISCKEVERFQNWYSATNALQNDISKRTSFDVGTSEEYTLLKKYFSQIRDLSVELVLNKKYQDRINIFLATKDLGVLCEQLFLKEEVLETINNACAKDGFYLCAPEVKNYPEFVKAIFDSMNESNKIIWTTSGSCPVLKN